MHRSRMIVLKFGGSVLNSESSLPSVVREIHGWRRDGWRVVAIVSALQGRTDELFGACRSIAPQGSPWASAAHVANGELYSASLLALYLDRAGIGAAVLHPAAIHLRAEGEPLDAQAAALDRALVLRALDQTGVVVLPGFIAVDHLGRTMLLGRGGSDLTALFVAHQLGTARCRLIKDVDGLYDCDPRAHGSIARRFVHATWDDALATDGSIVQHKAVRFARNAEYPFELGALGSEKATTIGSSATERADAPSNVVTPSAGARAMRPSLDRLCAAAVTPWPPQSAQH